MKSVSVGRHFRHGQGIQCDRKYFHSQIGVCQILKTVDQDRTGQRPLFMIRVNADLTDAHCIIKCQRHFTEDAVPVCLCIGGGHVTAARRIVCVGGHDRQDRVLLPDQCGQIIGV